MNLKLLWYCTKSDLKLYKTIDNDYTVKKAKDNIFGYEELNGKIVAESDFNVINIYGNINKDNQPYYEAHSWCLFHEDWITEKSRLNHDQLVKYLGAYKGLVGHAIYIKDLEIFKEPRELSDFYTYDDSYDNMFGCFFEDREKYIPLKNAPQNMCYAYDKYGNKYVVISTHPEWLCLILNGLKDVELRRKVLKEML